MPEDIDRLILIGSEIDKFASELEIDYIEACMVYCEKYDLEPELLGEVIKEHPKMVSNLRKEAESLNILEKSNTMCLQFE